MATTYKKLSYDGKPTMCDVAEKDSNGKVIADTYVSKSGDTFSKGAMFYFPDSGNWNNNNSGVTFPYSCGGFQWTDQSDGIQLYGEATANDNLDLVLRFTDDNSNKFSIRNSSNSQTSYITATGTGYFNDLYRNNKQVVTTDDSRLSDARKNPKSISFKNASGNTVWYSGSDEVNLTGGVFYATSAGSATTATTATNLANTPSLLTNTSNQIAVKAGEKTSSYITVPYATTAGNVNNGTLTIQTEGSSKGQFTANQAGDTTINITASDLGLSAAMKFLGTTTTAIGDGSTTNPITISGSSVKATSGNVVLYGSKEFVWTGSLWEELGDEGSHALKSIKIIGNGALSGGGNLEANRTITHNTVSRTNETSTTSPGYGGTFTAIDSVESDIYGHISKVNTKTITMPSSITVDSALSSTSTNPVQNKVIYDALPKVIR